MKYESTPLYSKLKEVIEAEFERMAAIGMIPSAVDLVCALEEVVTDYGEERFDDGYDCGANNAISH